MEHNLNKPHYIISLIKYKPVLYACKIFLELLTGAIPLIEGMIIKEFFDIIGGKQNSMFSHFQLVGFMAIATLIHILLKRLYFKNDSLHGFYMTTLLRRNMLNAILKQPGSKAINSSAGEVINSFRDDASQIKTIISWLGVVIGQIVRAVASIVILLYINVKITLLVFIPLILVIRVAQRSERNIEKNRVDGRNATGAVNGAIGEIFDSILSIKVSGSKKELMRNLNKLNDKRHKAMIKDSMVTQVIDSIYNNAINLGTGVILLLGAGAISTGTFTVGDFSIFVYYLAYVTDSVESLGNFMVYFKQTNVAYKNILKQVSIEDTPENLVKHKFIYLNKNNGYDDKKPNLISSENELKTLEVKGLTYLYTGTENGIKDINLTLKKGEVLVISGRTGCGKTTLVKTLIGLLPKNEGDICWNGKRVEEVKDFFIPPISAYIPQVPNLFSDSVKDNILLGLSEDNVDIDGAIKAAVFEKDLMELENGLDTVIGTKGTKLSGGQMQRVAAARMFIRKPQILVFDDISSALDVETEMKLWERLFNGEKPTCIIVSNKKVALENADRIIVMKDGRIEAEGDLRGLLNESEEMKKICS